MFEKGHAHSTETKNKIRAALSGRKLSKETIKKISLAKVGKKASEETKRKMSATRTGKKFSEETKEKMSKNNGRYWKGKSPSREIRKKLSNSLKGEKCYRWRGGITSLYHKIRTCFEHRQWRSDVFTRDNFTCQECGDNRGGNLAAHHIKEFSKILEEHQIKTLEQAIACEELWNINNGRTLCKTCHEGLHKKK